MEQQVIYTCYVLDPDGPRSGGTGVKPTGVRLLIEQITFATDGTINDASLSALQQASSMRTLEGVPPTIGVVMYYDTRSETLSVTEFKARACTLQAALSEVLPEKCIVSVAVKV